MGRGDIPSRSKPGGRKTCTEIGTAISRNLRIAARCCRWKRTKLAHLSQLRRCARSHRRSRQESLPSRSREIASPARRQYAAGSTDVQDADRRRFLLVGGFYLSGGGGGSGGTVTVTDVTGVVTVAPVGGLTGTVGPAGTVVTAGTVGTGASVDTEATTPPTVSVGEVETAEMPAVAPAGWAGSERSLGEDGSSVGAPLSAPCPETAGAGCRKTESPREPFPPTTASCPSTLGPKGRA